MNPAFAHHGLLMSAPPPPAVAYTTLNPADKATGIDLSGSDLVATASTTGSGIVRSVQTITGKQYFEAVLTNVASGGSSWAAGIANGSHSLTASLGYANADGWAYWASTPGARHNGATAISDSSTNGDVFGFAVDEPGHKLWIRKNGTWLQGDPATDTSPIWTDLSGTLYAAACPWASGAVVTMRFDPATFRDAAPSGFSPLTA